MKPSFFVFISFDFLMGDSRLFCILHWMTSFPAEIPVKFIFYFIRWLKKSTWTEENCNKFGWTSKIHERRNGDEKYRTSCSMMTRNAMESCYTFHFYRIFQHSLLHEHLNFSSWPLKVNKSMNSTSLRSAGKHWNAHFQTYIRCTRRSTARREEKN